MVSCGLIGTPLALFSQIHWVTCLSLLVRTQGKGKPQFGMWQMEMKRKLMETCDAS